MTTETIRVRQLLDKLNSVERTELKKLLPPKLVCPEEPPVRYPAALLSALPKPESYSLLGHITEALLRLPPIDITVDRLCAITEEWCPTAPVQKLRVSKTTEPYLQRLRNTRIKFRCAAVGDLRYEEEVGDGPVRGHPDARTATQIFEIKMTGQLKENWVAFLFQVFAYAALVPEATDIYLVLPLQELLWHYRATEWTKRTAFRDFLLAAAATKAQVGGQELIALHGIGTHTGKLKTLEETVRRLPNHRLPYQIFLSGTQTARMKLDDADLAATAVLVEETATRMFVHSQYLINLCNPAATADDFHTELLIKNLTAAAAAGFKGVVVHVGKHTTQDPTAALEHMRTNVLRAIEHATPECPLLLETPAGQGTEMLCRQEEFFEFIKGIPDPRLAICVDTCHVFARGYDPATYIQAALSDAELSQRLRLIHFNDSATPCGSRLDRHAFCGEGHIGIERMTAVAETCRHLPMLVE